MSDDLNDDYEVVMSDWGEESWLDKVMRKAREDGEEVGKDIGQAMMEAFEDQKSKDMGLKW